MPSSPTLLYDDWVAQQAQGGQQGNQQWQQGQQGEGNPFYVGSPPGPHMLMAGQGAGSPWGGTSYGLSPGELAAMQHASQQAEQAFQQGQGRLAPGQFANSQLGLLAGSRYATPYGFDQATKQGMYNRAQQVIKGQQAGALQKARFAAQSNGALDSAGMADLDSRLSAGAASDIVNADLGIDTQDQQMALQREQSSAQILAQLLNLEAGSNSQSAQGYFQRQFPVIPGSGEDGGDFGETGQYSFLNPDGSLKAGMNSDFLLEALSQRRRWLDAHGQSG